MTHFLLGALLAIGGRPVKDALQGPVAVVTQVKSAPGQLASVCGDNPNAIILRADLLSTGMVRFGWTTDGEVDGDETHTWNIVPLDYRGGYSFYYALIPDEGKTLTNSPNLTVATGSPDAMARSGIASGWTQSGTQPNPFYGGEQIAKWDTSLPKVMTADRAVFGVQRWSLKSPGAVRKTTFTLTISS